MRFFPKGTLVAGTGADCSIKIWDIRTQKLLQHYNAHSDEVNVIDFHPSGDYLVSGSDDTTIKVWDLREGHQLYTIHGHKAPVKSVAFSRDGQYFASSGEDRLVMVWKTNFDEPLPVETSFEKPAVPVSSKKPAAAAAPRRIMREPTAPPTEGADEPASESRTESVAPSVAPSDIASTLSHIVNQLDVIRNTMNLFDQRLTLQESMVSALAADKQKPPAGR